MAWVLDKNSSGYMEAVTLGNILAANKIRIVCENVTWNTTGYLFSQANTFSSNRELGLYIFSSTVRFYIGGVNNATGVSISPANETVDFTVDFTAGTALLVVGESTVFSGSASIGSNRVDGELFRFFGRNGGFLAPEGTQIGKVSIYIDDVLVRYYDPDSSDRSGSTDQPILTDTVGGNNATGVNFPSFDPNVWVDLGGGDIALTAGFVINASFISQILSDINTNSVQSNINNFSNTNNSLISLSGNQSQNNDFDGSNINTVSSTGTLGVDNNFSSTSTSEINTNTNQDVSNNFDTIQTVVSASNGSFTIDNGFNGLNNTIVLSNSDFSNDNDFDALLNVVTSGDLTLEANFGVNNGFSSTISSDITSTSDYNVDNELTSATTSVVASSGNFNQDNNLSSNIDNSVGILGNQYTSTSSNGSINTITSSINNFNVLIDLDSVVNTEIGVNSNQEIEIGVGSLIQLEISSNSDYTINTSFTATLFVGDFNPILSDTINFSYIESNLNMGYIEVVSLRIM